jgi:hypothetical protein
LVLWSSGVVVRTIFTNPIHLLYSFMKLYKRYRICEQNYFNFVEWRNDPNKSCSTWEVMNICNWKFFIWINLLLQNLISIYGYKFPIDQKKAHSKIHLCREPLSTKQLVVVGHKRLTTNYIFVVSLSQQNFFAVSRLFAVSFNFNHRQKVILL